MKKKPPSGLSTKIATQITELILRDGLETGAHLTEQWIADSLRVSRSPVRNAMEFLEGLGVLAKEPNRGYFLKKSPAALRRTTLSVDADPEEARYLQVAEDRLKGVLAGEFTETELMRRYQLTQAHTRRLLTRLAQEHLVHKKPGHGWEFEPVLDSVDAHNQSYRFRMIIEPAAVLEPAFKVDQAAFDRARQLQQAMLDGGILKLSRVELFTIGSEFHEMIVECSGNRYLLEALKRQNQLRRIIEYRAHLDRSRLVRQCQEHLKLLDLLEAGKFKTAATFMREHLDVVRVIKTGDHAEEKGSKLHAQL
jgi:DNA-binding GntR family transcriptional regulator